MQPAQRPILAQDGAFLNHRMWEVNRALAGDSILFNPSYIAEKQTGPFAAFRQEIEPCRLWIFRPRAVIQRY